MMNDALNTNLEARKRSLQAELAATEGHIRKDMAELRDDLNPLEQAGQFLKNMLAPTASPAPTTALGFVANTGLNLILSRALPGNRLGGVRTAAAFAIRSLAVQALPTARLGLIHFLEWVVKKTAAPASAPEQPCKRPQLPMNTVLHCPCGLMSKDPAQIRGDISCLCGTVMFGEYGIAWVSEAEFEQQAAAAVSPGR